MYEADWTCTFLLYLLKWHSCRLCQLEVVLLLLNLLCWTRNICGRKTDVAELVSLK